MATRLRPGSLALAALLTALVAYGPISTDMYLPSLPALARAFETDMAGVQLTLSVFLIGLAGGQLVYGPLSDRFGRRPVLLVGLVLYLAASLACVMVTGIEALVAARFVQAIGACAGQVVGRAIVRDVYGRDGAARIFAYMGMAMGLVPTLAPILGGYLEAAFGWQANFLFLAGFGALVLLAVATGLGESNRSRNPEATRPGPVLRAYAGLLADRRYLGYVLAATCMYSGLFAFISGSSFVLIEFIGLPPQVYGYCFGAVAFGFMCGALAAGRLTTRLGLDLLIRAGALLGCVAGLTGLGLAVAGIANAVAITAPMVVFAMGMGLVLPNAQAGAIGPYPHMAGTAAAMLGFAQMGLAAGFGILVGHAHDGTQLPMLTAIAAAGVAALAVAFRLLPRLPEPLPEPPPGPAG